MLATIQKLREIIVELDNAGLWFEAAQVASTLELIDAHTREKDAATIRKL
ncbi:MAG: hypothetical protein VW935_09060 [Novosphingobium sp.]